MSDEIDRLTKEAVNLSTENFELKGQIEGQKKAFDHIENELAVISHRVSGLILQLKSAKVDATKLFGSTTREAQRNS
jgi:uncharacterized coiled-coil DUF342 family protein